MQFCFDRMSEEVEKKTDVRGSGMHGFYANLLTKNVSMGGDVVTSAISAYTAGSARQGVMLGDEVGEKVENEGDKQDQEVNRNKRAMADVSENEENKNNDENVDKRKLFKSADSREETLVSTNSTAIPVDVPVVARETVVASAKERYLARKKLSS